MESPIEIHDELKADLELKESEVAVVHGLVIGNVYVRGSSSLILHGIIKGDLNIEEQGEVFLHGMVSGDVEIKGGKLNHYGMIRGKLNKLGGDVVIHMKAVVQEEMVS